jgi:hypothetical protein
MSGFVTARRPTEDKEEGTETTREADSFTREILTLHEGVPLRKMRAETGLLVTMCAKARQPLPG